MKKSKEISRVVVAGVLIVAILVGFSVPWGMIPPLGYLFNPNGGLWSINHKSPPTMSLELPDLQGNVEVIKDEWGIPHIYAEFEIDAYRVMGYVQAYDRLFQLEMTKRQISGTLSEVVGKSTIEVDKYFRNLQLRKNAYLLVDYLQAESPEIYAYLQAFIAGINYRIKEVKILPIEFQFLGIKPTLWEPVDVLQIQNYMSFMLTYTEEDLLRTLVQMRLNDTYPTAVAELYPARSPFQMPISPDYGSYPDQPNMAGGISANPLINSIESILYRSQLANEFSNSMGMGEKNWIGSNNWVVASNKSATNAPILCNDMHLAWSLPMIWYEAHLIAKNTNLNVQGFSIPGVPFIIVGHNANLAWGMTNAQMDHIDFYFYKGNATHYWYEPQGKYLPYESYIEELHVKGEATVQYEIKETIHGPILNNPSYNEVAVPIAFKWVSLTNLTRTFFAINQFNHASNFSEFNTALADFAIPSQNIVYADVEGNIAIRSTGWVPIRENVNRSSDVPRFIINGSAGLYEWNGFIPTDELPHSINPSQGYLVSANHWNAGPDYPYYTQSSATTFRGTRINRLLATDPEVSVEDMQKYQLDDFDLTAEWFVPLVLNAYDSSSFSFSKTTITDQAIALVRAWNNSVEQYQMKTSLAAPTIFKAIYDNFTQLTIDDEFGAILGSSIPYPDPAVLENLSINVPNSKWFDVVGTDSIEARDDIIALAIIQGISYLSGSSTFQNLSPDLWLYGDAHTAMWGHLTGLSGFGRGPYSVNGSGNTVNVSPAKLFRSATMGPSERMILDFSQADMNFNSSFIVIPGGSSGDPANIHYDDQLQLFLAGKYHSLNYYSTIAKFPTQYIENHWTFIGGTQT